jgi:two-component system sensor histidine kinase AlgZ
MADQTQQDTGSVFFIPDLCATRPVLFMLILAELLVVVYVLGESNLPEIAWETLALASLFVQWIVLLCAACLCTSRTLLAHLSLPLGVVVCYLIVLLVTLVSSLVAMLVFREPSFAQMDGWWIMRNLVVAAVFGGIAFRFFYLQQQLREQEQAELKARIESLRARIRPHFLFNTMNSIASLIGSRPQQAEQAVEDLSELFRASLIENSRVTTVADELHLCRLYLGIEQLRLGERLHVDWNIDEAMLNAAMPALLLQPLVENAVYHGVALMASGGTVAITVSERAGNVHVCIDNPLPAESRSSGSGHQMALENIQQRLVALYEEGATINIEHGDGMHRVELSLPREPVQ